MSQSPFLWTKILLLHFLKNIEEDSNRSLCNSFANHFPWLYWIGSFTSKLLPLFRKIYLWKKIFWSGTVRLVKETHTVYFVWWVSPQISGFWVSPPKHVARGFFIPLYNYLVIFLASAATINGKPGINTKSFLTSNFTTLCFKRTNDILYIFIYNMYIYLVPFHLTLLLKFEVQALFWGVGWPSQKMTHPWLPDGEFRVARAVGSNGRWRCKMPWEGRWNEVL